MVGTAFITPIRGCSTDFGHSLKVETIPGEFI